MDRIVSEYKRELEKIKNTGIATELSYYCPLKIFINKIAKKYSKKHKDIIVIPEAKSKWFGKPDFTILDTKNRLIGIIEAKLPNVNLINVEKTAQIKGYREQIPNFILTDFYNFRLYNHKNNKIENVNINDNIIKLLTTFLSKTIPKNYNNNFILTKKQIERRNKYGYVDIIRDGKTKTIIDNKYIIMNEPLTKKEIQDLNRCGCVNIVRNSYLYEVFRNGKSKLYTDE